MFGKYIRYPIQLLTKNATGKLVGTLYAQAAGRVNVVLGNAFKAVFPNGWSRWVPGIKGGVTYMLEEGGTKSGFVHMMRRHLAQYYDGSLQAVTQVTHFWPTGTTPLKVLDYLDEAVARVGGLPSIPAGMSALNTRIKSVLLDGTPVELWVEIQKNIVKVKSFYPTGGANISTIQEIVSRGFF